MYAFAHSTFRPTLRYLAPALRLSADKSAIVADDCDPSSADASAKDRQHSTTHGQERVRAIAVLRELDMLYLGGVLHHAEEILAPLVVAPEHTRKEV